MSIPKTGWYPTKFEWYKGKLRSSREIVGLGSRLMADLQAAAYEIAIKKYAKGRLIDLGCGNAPLTGCYRAVVNEYVWADWPNSAHQLFALDHEIDLNQPLPFGDGCFDTILLSDVLEHILEPASLFSELERILRPNGYLIIGVPFLYWIHEEPHDHYRYTRYKLDSFGKRNNLDVTEIAEFGGALDVMCDLSCKVASYIWPPLASIPYYAWISSRALPYIRRLNANTRSHFPIGYIAVYSKK